MRFRAQKIFTFLHFYIFTFFLIMTLPVLAGPGPAVGLVPCGDAGEPSCSLCYFFLMIDRVIDFILWKFAFPLAILFLVIGGVMFIISGASEEMRTRGKNILTSVFMGIFIIFLSWSIIEIVMNVLANPGALPWPWNEIDCTP